MLKMTTTKTSSGMPVMATPRAVPAAGGCFPQNTEISIYELAA